MKTRAGFVSNSSSSSFVCDVCRKQESGYEMTLREAGMRSCNSGHTYCSHHSSRHENNLTTEEKRQAMIEMSNNEEKKQEYRLLFVDGINDEWNGWIKEGLEYEGPSIMCPICQLESITGEVLAQYLVLKLGKTRENLEKELRNEFNNLSELEEKCEQVEL